MLAWKLRTNVRLNRAKLFVANDKAIKLERQATATLRLPANGYSALAAYLGGSDAMIHDAAFREAVLAEESLLVIFGSGVLAARRLRNWSPGG